MINYLKLVIFSILRNSLGHCHLADIQLFALLGTVLVLKDGEAVLIALYAAGCPCCAKSDLAVVGLLPREDDLSSLLDRLVHRLEETTDFLV